MNPADEIELLELRVRVNERRIAVGERLLAKWTIGGYATSDELMDAYERGEIALTEDELESLTEAGAIAPSVTGEQTFDD
jgi:hypothetical protein